MGAGRPCAGRLCLPFPPAGCLDASLPVSRCQAWGAAPLAGSRVAGGSLKTPDPPGTPLPPSHLGEPRRGMRRGLEPRHTRGGGGQCLCPGAAEGHRGAIPRKGSLRPPTLLFLPREATFQATGPPAPRTATFGHTLPPQWPPDVMSYLTAHCSGTL